MGAAKHHAAVAQVMLRGRQGPGQVLTPIRILILAPLPLPLPLPLPTPILVQGLQALLKAAGIGRGESADPGRIRAQGLEGASPADVVDDRHHRSEVPINADGG